MENVQHLTYVDANNKNHVDKQAVMSQRFQQESAGYANKKSLIAPRTQAIAQTTALNALKSHVREFMQARVDTVIKQCMAPGMHVDLKQQNLQMRFQAMDALFAAREAVSRACLEQSVKGLEARTRENLNRYSGQDTLSASLEDAEMATIGWVRFAEITHRYRTPIASVASAVRYLAASLDRPLDADYLQMHVLYECFRRQLRAVPRDTNEKLILCRLFLDELTTHAAGLYGKAEELVAGFMDGENPLPANFDATLHETSDAFTVKLYRAVAAVAPMFSAIEKFSHYSDDARKHLLSIRPHMVLLAMADIEAFEQESHPARQLIDSLTQRWRGIMDPEDKRHKDLVVLVEKLIATSGGGSESYADLLHRQATLD